MNKELYSNIDFTDIKNRINKEMLRRGTYKWWDPLSKPKVGEDRSSPLSIPIDEDSIPVDDRTYTVNNPSEGSIEETRNIGYPAQGENPSGQDPGILSAIPNASSVQYTSAAQLNVDELKNLLVGLSKIQDINLFYGRDEYKGLAFRDPSGIEDVLVAAEKDVLNKPLKESDISPTKTDPLTGKKVTYPIENGKYVMPSGEYDGEETDEYTPLGQHNFYDDYGAEPGNSNYHPYNRYETDVLNRDQINQDNDRNDTVTPVRIESNTSIRFGPNPRNPQKGGPLPPRDAYGGVKTSCNNACVGLCYTSCDNQCSESCSTTCWGRCGNACTSTCGNNCTGCSSQCYQTCKTKCENNVGYSCVYSGVKSYSVTSSGGYSGEAATNVTSSSTHICDGCSYSCQFYPNKRTQCWDAGCMSNCYSSCSTSCSTSCYGGCIDNAQNSGDSYKTGVGRGCSSGCTLNCIGACSGVCEGSCVQTCFKACMQSCSDNCTWACSTSCGSGCANGCNAGCTGCTSCTGTCSGASTSRVCTGCGPITGCTASCRHDCNTNCIGWGCRSICGIEAAGACEANCRLNCMGTSCTSLCSQACSSTCTTCVNTCGFQCGACSSECSTGCAADCNITCKERCQHSCEESCVHSCMEACGGCSNLCYSCVGMCIGVCSIRCTNNCSSCTKMCGGWCDSSCNMQCSSNCDNTCISTCTGSCATHLTSETTHTNGPERGPTASGYIYPHPKNRWEERESFKIIRDIDPYKPDPKREYLVTITFDPNRNLLVIYRGADAEYDNGGLWTGYYAVETTMTSGVYSVDQTTGEIVINPDLLPGKIFSTQFNYDGGSGIYAVIIFRKDNITKDDIECKLPFGYESYPYVFDKNGNIVVILKRTEFLLPHEMRDDNG